MVQVNCTTVTSTNVHMNCMHHGRKNSYLTVGLVAGTPFVCKGACALGTSVECWKPTSSAFVAAEHAWIKCGNAACIKLVDPSVEHAISLEDAGTIRYVGIGMAIIGVPVICITICFYRAAKKGQANVP